MNWPLAILCYHRVLPEEKRAAEGRPYFARGTAVSELNFTAHVYSLQRSFDVVAEAQVLDWLGGESVFSKPSCWITFDDGYHDIVRTVAPILQSAGLAATAFVTTGVADDRGRWLPADRWYAILNSATKRRGTLLDADGRQRSFDLELDYARFIDGRERRAFLAAPAIAQDRMQSALAESLGVAELSSPDLYLDWGDMKQLAEVGWSIGGHGATHAILTNIPSVDGVGELTTCRQALEGHGLQACVFAYPDGAHDARVAFAASDAGWAAAVALENRTARCADGAFNLPRFIPSDDPAWVDNVLLCAYAATLRSYV